MIGTPLNDRRCLDQVAARVAAFSEAEGRDLVAELGLRSVPELVEFVRRLPQRNDDGDPGDGPKIACDVLQRLRLPASDPNCVERTALVVALGEVLAPGSVWQMATVDTPVGRHTYPTQDGRPLDVDPAVEAPALEVAQFALRQASGVGHSLADLAALVEQLALRNASGEDRARVLEGAGVIQCCPRQTLTQAELEALGFVLARAEVSARDFGAQGLDAVRTSRAAIGELRNAVAGESEQRPRVIKRRRKKKRATGLKLGGLTLVPDLEKLTQLGNVAARVGSRVASTALQAKLASMGISPDLIRATEEELQKDGLTLGPLVPPEPKTAKKTKTINPLDLLLLGAVL